MGESLKTTKTPDGRVLAFAIWGDPAGFPIMSLHGTPGSRLSRWPREDLYKDLGACIVTHDRAGYGRSTRRPGRTVADEAEDVLLLADNLGFERFEPSADEAATFDAVAEAPLDQCFRMVVRAAR